MTMFTSISHLLLAHWPQGLEIIEGAATRCPQCGHAAKRDQASGLVLPDGGLKDVPGDGEVLVSVQEPHPDPGQQPRPLHAAVSLLGAVTHQPGHQGPRLLLPVPLLPDGLGPGGQDGHQSGLTGGALVTIQVCFL